MALSLPPAISACRLEEIAREVTAMSKVVDLSSTSWQPVSFGPSATLLLPAAVVAATVQLAPPLVFAAADLHILKVAAFGLQTNVGGRLTAGVGLVVVEEEQLMLATVRRAVVEVAAGDLNRCLCW
mmetsp:Transcript_7803/g.18014  ORF Transcript_7803/g.18014 Transcript_7803/m.18014 type:complete len:126 (+) Transcript_7803:1437-1814(+)